MGGFQLTRDHHESTVAVNYLSHFYLTSLLLPQVAEGGTPSRMSRVVITASEGHRSVTKAND